MENACASTAISACILQFDASNRCFFFMWVVLRHCSSEQINLMIRWNMSVMLTASEQICHSTPNVTVEEVQDLNQIYRYFDAQR